MGFRLLGFAGNFSFFEQLVTNHWWDKMRSHYSKYMCLFLTLKEHFWNPHSLQQQAPFGVDSTLAPTNLHASTPIQGPALAEFVAKATEKRRQAEEARKPKRKPPPPAIEIFKRIRIGSGYRYSFKLNGQPFEKSRSELKKSGYEALLDTYDADQEILAGRSQAAMQSMRSNPISLQ
jgi:hypothetical protein